MLCSPPVERIYRHFFQYERLFGRRGRLYPGTMIASNRNLAHGPKPLTHLTLIPLPRPEANCMPSSLPSSTGDSRYGWSGPCADAYFAEYASNVKGPVYAAHTSVGKFAQTVRACMCVCVCACKISVFNRFGGD